MIDLPIGKALVAVESDVQCNTECMTEDLNCSAKCCEGCELTSWDLKGIPDTETCGCLCCISSNRRDGKNTIYKLIDYPYFSLGLP